MNKKSKRLLAIGALCTAIGIALLFLPFRATTKSATVQSNVTYWRPPAGLAGELQIHTLAAHVEYPDKVKINDSFFVALDVSVVKSRQHDFVVDRDDLPPVNENPTEPFDVKKLFFRLEMQGIDTSPQQATAVSQDGVIHWSAMAKSPGNFNGIIAFDTPAAKQADDFMSPLEKFEFEEPVKLSITAADPFFTLPKILGYILAFLGSVATLPGLFAFWKSHIKASKAKEGRESGVILPGDSRYTPPK